MLLILPSYCVFSSGTRDKSNQSLQGLSADVQDYHTPSLIQHIRRTLLAIRCQRIIRILLVVPPLLDASVLPSIDWRFSVTHNQARDDWLIGARRRNML